jgi:uncharacterized membrane protein HdeD (DUF308 family)
MSNKNWLLTILNGLLTIIGGARMIYLIQAPTVYEQFLWSSVIIISGVFSIYYFGQRRYNEKL